MAKKDKRVKENKQYFKEMKAELKKVVWPTPKQLFNNTVAVIAFVLIFAIIVFVLDVCFDSINKFGILKLQQKVQSSFSSSDERTENETEGSNESVNVEDESKEAETESQETESSENTAVETTENTETQQVEVQETPVTSETE